MAAESPTPDAAEAGRFELTRWSVVVAAGGDDSKLAHKALEHLCHAYWYPLYAFVRREGHSAHDAQDLTQEFFARLLQKGWLQAVRREKGRFRSFLLASMRHFLANEWDRAHALKRGGRQSPISLDASSAEERYALEPADPMTAHLLYKQITPHDKQKRGLMRRLLICRIRVSINLNRPHSAPSNAISIHV